MVNLTTRCPQGEGNPAMLTAARFRVVCLLLTTSGEVVSSEGSVTREEIGYEYNQVFLPRMWWRSLRHIL
ncbi:hypothetical protein CQP61_12550 [Escherichia coli]|nr:hypothetical protein CQP61_12550 [Escherichia coli]EFN8408954.1 hypothetical protein [Escherichia coli O15]EGO8732871.1 hypothetical protein [Escherichia coli]MDN1945743.1 hypothetical protein [Escherichia coli]MGT37751.1 hypothetical protein [Escherichia coli]